MFVKSAGLKSAWRIDFMLNFKSIERQQIETILDKTWVETFQNGHHQNKVESGILRHQKDKKESIFISLWRDGRMASLYFGPVSLSVSEVIFRICSVLFSLNNKQQSIRTNELANG